MAYIELEQNKIPLHEEQDLNRGILPFRIESGAWIPLKKGTEVAYPSFVQERKGERWVPARLPQEFFVELKPQTEAYL